jgi:ABC-type sulfate/molybdate transport systems ATPase subunit
MRERAGSAVLITHDPGDAFDLADRVAVMEGGRIVQVGTPHDLTTDPATPFVAAFTGAELLLDGVVESAGGRHVVDVRAGGFTLVARCPDAGLEPGDHGPRPLPARGRAAGPRGPWTSAPATGSP